jgi:Flp pilus assembly protein TadG
MPNGRRGNERGVIIIWFALFLLMILGFVALGIDMAKLAATHTQLQNAADAAALAAASAIDPELPTLRQDVSIGRAAQTGVLNKAFVATPQPVTVAAPDVEFLAPTDVKVTARRQAANAMVTTMAQVFGLPRLEIRATATARAEIAQGLLCTVPIGVHPPDNGFLTGCMNRYGLRLAQNPGHTGNYGWLAFPSCPSTPCIGSPTSPAQIACLTENNWCCELFMGQQVGTSPGVKVRGENAIRARFDADTDQRLDICYSEYRGNGKRIVLCPVISGFMQWPYDVTVVGFTSMFITRPFGPDHVFHCEYVLTTAAGTAGGYEYKGGAVYTVRLVD